MKTNIYKLGVVATALAMSVLPAIALADSDGGSEKGDIERAQVGVSTQSSAQTAVTAGVKPSIKGVVGDDGDGDRELNEDAKTQERESEGVRAGATQTTSLTPGVKPSIKGSVGDDDDRGASDEINEGIENIAEQELADLEDDEMPVASLTALKQKIEKQTQKLQEAVASTTSPAKQNRLKNTNKVRIATNSLVVSKNLLGGIGQQVSEIAKKVSDSVATTTVAEAKIQSRGFFTRLFFGGDSVAAKVINEEVSQNQQHIDQLAQLLGQANISSDIKTTLDEQISALKDAQARLQDLARKEQKMWGLLSWRLF